MYFFVFVGEEIEIDIGEEDEEADNDEEEEEEEEGDVDAEVPGSQPENLVSMEVHNDDSNSMDVERMLHRQ